MDDPDIAFLVRIGAEIVFVVVSIDPPVLRDGFEAIGPPVAIGVGEFGDFGSGGGVEGTVAVEHAKGFVKSAGEKGPLHLGEVLIVGTLANPDVAASGGDGYFFVRHDGDGTEFEDFALGGGDFLAKVEFSLALVGDGGGNEKAGK